MNHLRSRTPPTRHRIRSEKSSIATVPYLELEPTTSNDSQKTLAFPDDESPIDDWFTASRDLVRHLPLDIVEKIIEMVELIPDSRSNLEYWKTVSKVYRKSDLIYHKLSFQNQFRQVHKSTLYMKTGYPIDGGHPIPSVAMAYRIQDWSRLHSDWPGSWNPVDLAHEKKRRGELWKPIIDEAKRDFHGINEGCCDEQHRRRQGCQEWWLKKDGKVRKVVTKILDGVDRSLIS